MNTKLVSTYEQLLLKVGKKDTKVGKRKQNCQQNEVENLTNFSKAISR
jgi:hypothetical protein